MVLLRKARLVAAILGLLVIAASLVADDYTITDLGLLQGATSSQAFGINDSGQVVGYSTFATIHGYTVASLWQNGQMASLGLGALSEAYGINASGQIVGWSGGAFLWQNGVTTRLGPGAAFAINNAGQVVGASDYFPDQSSHAFLWQNGTYTDLGTGWANAINASGRIAGTSNGNAVYWQNGTMTTLGPGSANGINAVSQIVGVSNGDAVLWQNGMKTVLGVGIAEAINDLGQVVGGTKPALGERAFLWQNGTLTDLNNLIPANSGWTLEDASAINNVGQIVGYGEHRIGQEGFERAFLLTPNGAPVPEPSTLWLIGIVILCLLSIWVLGRNADGVWADWNGSPVIYCKPISDQIGLGFKLGDT